MTTVRINLLFQEYAELPAVAEVTGETVGECLDDFIRQFPHARTWLFSQDNLLRVIISINNLDIVTPGTKGVNRKLSSGDEISIFAIASGG